MDRCIAVCCRISRDKSGRMEGVAAQEVWGRAYAAEHWPGVPVEVFSDGNNSAMSDGPRPEHDRFKEWLADGRIGAVWAVEQSRLERDEMRWFGLAAELDAAGIHELHTRREGTVDVHGLAAGLKAVINASEVRVMKRRLHDTLDEKAAAGLPPGGAHACYRAARTPDGTKTLEPIHEAAEAYRWAAGAVLAGWSLANVTAELRRRGLTGSRRKLTKDDAGKVIGSTPPRELQSSAVKSALLSPTIAGLRVHHGKIGRAHV